MISTAAFVPSPVSPVTFVTVRLPLTSVTVIVTIVGFVGYVTPGIGGFGLTSVTVNSYVPAARNLIASKLPPFVTLPLPSLFTVISIDRSVGISILSLAGPASVNSNVISLSFGTGPVRIFFTGIGYSVGTGVYGLSKTAYTVSSFPSIT